MFGLLQSPGPVDSGSGAYRLHYCGVCKIIGRDYGQAARLSLNSDVVFLARLLSAINNEDTATWGGALQSYNCLKLPVIQQDTPASLQYAAAINVMLAGFKIADNRSDERSIKWRLAGRIFKRPFSRSFEQLGLYGVPVERIKRLMEAFNAREKQLFNGSTRTVLNWYAKPVALATALAMGYGVANGPARAALLRFGYAFGKLVYLLDAYRDRDDDRRKKRFNPLFYVSGTVDAAQVYELAASLQQQLLNAIEALPVTKVQKDYFASAIRLNTEKEFSKAGWMSRAAAACNHQAEKYGFKKRWQTAVDSVRFLAQRHSAAFTNKPLARMRYRALLLTAGFGAIFTHPSAAAAVKEQATSGYFSIADILWAGPLMVLAGGCCCCCCEKKDNDKGNCKNSSSSDSKCCKK